MIINNISEFALSIQNPQLEYINNLEEYNFKIAIKNVYELYIIHDSRTNLYLIYI
jgi:hypothetical protein